MQELITKRKNTVGCANMLSELQSSMPDNNAGYI